MFLVGTRGIGRNAHCSIRLETLHQWPGQSHRFHCTDGLEPSVSWPPSFANPTLTLTLALASSELSSFQTGHNVDLLPRFAVIICCRWGWCGFKGLGIWSLHQIYWSFDSCSRRLKLHSNTKLRQNCLVFLIWITPLRMDPRFFGDICAGDTTRTDVARWISHHLAHIKRREIALVA